MSTRRSSVGVGVVGSFLYSVGGYDGHSRNYSNIFSLMRVPLYCGNIYYLYILLEYLFIDIAPIYWSIYWFVSSESVHPALDKIWILKRQCLSSVERYDPDADEWTKVADMTTRRSGAGVGVIDGLLYAVGGHDGPTVRKSAEVFHPQVGKNVIYDWR